MMPSLLEFFSYKYNFEILREFIDSRKTRSTKLSVGLLDWFNVNYSKEYGVEYILKREKPDGNPSQRVVHVWQLYNAALAGYTKALFDPFARGKGKAGIKICNGEDAIDTTLCQLNYFRWAIKHGVIDYVKEHLEEIYEDFAKRSGRNVRGGRTVQSDKAEPGKKQLSVSASKTLGIHDVKMTIKFSLGDS